MTTTADKMFEEWVEQYPIQIAGDDYEMCKDAWKAALAASAQHAPATVPDNSQDWAGMDGATAWHLIDRHADGWSDVGKMMAEWLEANRAQQVEGEAVAVRAQEHWDECKRLAAICPELNLSNYGPDDVDELNAWAIEIAVAVEALAATHPTQPTSAAVPEGYKLLKDSTHAERAWIEDAGHENGLYSNTCIECGREFAGHKRRVICRVCAAAPTQPVPAGHVAWVVRKPGGYSDVGYESRVLNKLEHGTLLYASPHQVAVPLTDEQIEALAHRIAWRYKKSSDPHHSDTYTFNRDTLIQFARAIERAHGIAAPTKEQTNG